MLKRQPIKCEPSIVDEFIKAIQESVDSGKTSMSKLARDAKISRPYLYRILSGEVTPSIAAADKIARLVGFTLRLEKISDLVA